MISRGKDLLVLGIGAHEREELVCQPNDERGSHIDIVGLSGDDEVVSIDYVLNPPRADSGKPFWGQAGGETSVRIEQLLDFSPDEITSGQSISVGLLFEHFAVTGQESCALGKLLEIAEDLKFLGVQVDLCVGDVASGVQSLHCLSSWSVMDAL